MTIYISCKVNVKYLGILVFDDTLHVLFQICVLVHICLAICKMHRYLQSESQFIWAYKELFFSSKIKFLPNLVSHCTNYWLWNVIYLSCLSHYLINTNQILTGLPMTAYVSPCRPKFPIFGLFEFPVTLFPLYIMSYPVLTCVPNLKRIRPFL
jgi:hypothetical protein